MDVRPGTHFRPCLTCWRASAVSIPGLVGVLTATSGVRQTASRGTLAKLPEIAMSTMNVPMVNYLGPSGRMMILVIMASISWVCIGRSGTQAVNCLWLA